MKTLKKEFHAVMQGEKNVDHTDMLVYGDGYIYPWFCFQLLRDAFASRAFIGNNPEILNNENWQDINIKNM